jgi:hypothetical protein
MDTDKSVKPSMQLNVKSVDGTEQKTSNGGSDMRKRPAGVVNGKLDPIGRSPLAKHSR